jgi:hypothetical protein
MTKPEIEEIYNKAIETIGMADCYTGYKNKPWMAIAYHECAEDLLLYIIEKYKNGKVMEK